MILKKKDNELQPADEGALAVEVERRATDE